MGQGHHHSRRLCEPCHVTFVSNWPLVLGHGAPGGLLARPTVKAMDPGRAPVGAQRTRDAQGVVDRLPKRSGVEGHLATFQDSRGETIG